MMSISEAIRQTPFLLGQLLERPTALYPDRAALECEEGSLTFKQLSQRIQQREKALARLGASRFQRWGICLTNSADFVITLFALLRLGCVAAPLRESLPPERYRLAVAGASLRALVFQSQHPALAELAGAAARVIEIDEQLTAVVFGSTEALKKSGTSVDLDPALLLWSSGTAGQARGVVLQHHAVLANIHANICSLGYRDEDRTLVVLPLTHAYALVHQCLCHLAIGATVCLPSAPLVPPLLCRALERFQITTLVTVPPVLKMLVEGVRQSGLTCSKLRLTTVGAARADPLTVDDFIQLLPHTQLAITYGLTEAGPRVSTFFVGLEKFAPDCVGTPLPNTEVRLAPANGGTRQIIVRSRSLMRGYAHEVFEEGNDYLLRTTDEGSMKDNRLHISGRAERVINRGGSLVLAETIEQVLQTHPAVKSAQVDAEPHPFWGEVPVARVQLHSHLLPVSVEQLDRFCAERLSREERPLRITLCPPSVVDEVRKEQQMRSLFQDE